MSGIECGGVRTVVEVWYCLQDMAIGVEDFWPTDSTGDVSERVQDDLGIDEVPKGDSPVESFAKRNCGGHVCKLSETGAFRFLSYLRDQRPQNTRQRFRLVPGPGDTWTQVI